MSTATDGFERTCEDLKRAAALTPLKERVARLSAEILATYLTSADYIKYFRICEAGGVHVTPVHFYFPVPDTRELSNRLWDQPSALPGLDFNEHAQLDLLATFPRFRREYDSIPTEETGDPGEFYFNNPNFSGTDALALYCMIRHFRPASVIEVGSGFSSRVIRRAIRQNGQGRVSCIDPFAVSGLPDWFPEATVRREPVQAVPPSVFEALRAGDILFIDSSHVAQIGSDVTYLFLEIIPRLHPGVVVHLHDIFLPMEMRKEWVLDEMRFWTEQYLLQAFQAFNREFEVLMANSYLGLYHVDVLRATFPRSPWWGGGSFWMRRMVRPAADASTPSLMATRGGGR